MPPQTLAGMIHPLLGRRLAIPVVSTIDPPSRISGVPYFADASAAQYRSSNTPLALFRSISRSWLNCNVSPAVKDQMVERSYFLEECLDSRFVRDIQNFALRISVDGFERLPQTIRAARSDDHLRPLRRRLLRHREPDPRRASQHDDPLVFQSVRFFIGLLLSPFTMKRCGNYRMRFMHNNHDDHAFEATAKSRPEPAGHVCGDRRSQEYYRGGVAPAAQPARRQPRAAAGPRDVSGRPVSALLKRLRIYDFEAARSCRS